MKIKDLYIYPVKSLRGCSVPTATLTRHGLKHDRKYMIVRITPSDCNNNVDSNNNNVNGSTGGKGKYTYESQYVGRVDSLCLFSASILPNYENAEVIRVTYNTPVPSSGTNEKEKQEDDGDDDNGGNPYIEFPIIADYKNLEKVDLSIHLSDCVGYDMGPEYQEFFTKYLGYPAKLVYVGDGTREVKGNLAPNQTHLTKENDFDGGPTAGSNDWFIFGLFTWVLWYLLGWNKNDIEGHSKYTIQFADVAPVLVTSTVSLEELNSGKGEDGKNELVLDITKMRSNIVLEPSTSNEMTPFEEDYWAELEVSNGKNNDDDEGSDRKEARRIILTGNCGRCKSLNVDYETGKQLPVHGQMLKRLSDMKRRVDAGYGYSPIFGRYGFIEKGSLEKEVRVGEEVTVTKKNEERTVFYWPGLSSGTKPRK
ncbi:hypothetical protein TWF970_005193 [Orbilia oligospora]|uniref:MOSC domain-containing protein n=1 Tax=Orbilia oligospora TaxID=2813651 RepID=A0A7C8R964_ORBOL|nr:hypothetical protein TWF970_005193 [Orbilia oligospora]